MLTIEKLRYVIGCAPDKVPLEATVLERIDRDGYEQLKVEYTVEAGDRIAAYLLLPKGASEPGPAVICHHQHAGNFELGKSEVVGLAGDPDQAIGPELARQGIVVLAPDAIGFEERNWSERPGRAQYFELTTRLVKGETLLAKALADVSVGLDYLCTMSAVDKDRMGFIGHSYGGRMAIWSAAIDARIKASVSNCGCINYQDSMNRDIGIQAEFCVPGIMDVADIEEIIRLISPRALYVSATDNDKYSLGAKRMFEETRDAFPPGKLACQVWEGGHEFTERMRKAAYKFLKVHL